MSISCASMGLMVYHYSSLYLTGVTNLPDVPEDPTFLLMDVIDLAWAQLLVALATNDTNPIAECN